MNDLNDKIREALKGTDNEVTFKDDGTIIEELVGMFRGKHRGLLAFAAIMSFTLFAVAVWTGFKCYHAEVLRTQLLWGGASICCMISVGLTKIYFWMEMHTNRVLREMKRIELLLLQKN